MSCWRAISVFPRSVSRLQDMREISKMTTSPRRTLKNTIFCLFSSTIPHIQNEVKIESSYLYPTDIRMKPQGNYKRLGMWYLDGILSVFRADNIRDRVPNKRFEYVNSRRDIFQRLSIYIVGYIMGTRIWLVYVETSIFSVGNNIRTRYSISCSSLFKM